MKIYHYYFIFLKVFVVAQFIVIVLKGEQRKSLTYLISEFIFKISIGLFLIFYFWIHRLPDMEYEDRLIISFGGGLLVFDAVFNTIPVVFERLGLKNETIASRRE